MIRPLLLVCRLAAVALAVVSLARPAAAEDLSLAAAIRLAKQRAPEMAAASADVAGADARARVARAPYWPTLEATATGQEAAIGDQAAVLPPRVTPIRSVTYTTSGTAAASLRWALIDFGRTSRAARAADALADASRASAFDVESRLIEAVAGLYLDVVFTERVRDIQRAIVQDREASIDIVKALVKQGLVPAVDEMRAGTRAEAARRDYEASEAALVEARLGLLALLGLDAKARVTFVRPRIPRLRTEPEGAADEADAARPSVVAARATAAAGAATADAARSRYYPSVSLRADTAYRMTRVDLFDTWVPTRSASGALVVSIPLFDPATGPSVDAADADAAKAEAVYASARRDARTEAVRAVAGVRTSDRVVEHARKASESATAVLMVIRARYVRGLSSTLDVIDAETTDADARVAAARAERAADGALVRLLTATGQVRRVSDT